MESLRKAGGEYGAATGRPRRVGPFDAVASRYGLKCQNADQIALTKLDVLSQFDEIPIIVGYKKDGQFVDHFDPTDNLELCEPVLKYIPDGRKIFLPAPVGSSSLKMPVLTFCRLKNY